MLAAMQSARGDPIARFVQVGNVVNRLHPKTARSSLISNTTTMYNLLCQLCQLSFSEILRYSPVFSRPPLPSLPVFFSSHLFTFLLFSLPLFTSLLFTSLLFTSLCFTSLFSSPFFTSLHFASLLLSSLLPLPVGSLTVTDEKISLRVLPVDQTKFGCSQTYRSPQKRLRGRVRAGSGADSDHIAGSACQFLGKRPASEVVVLLVSILKTLLEDVNRSPSSIAVRAHHGQVAITQGNLEALTHCMREFS